MDKITHEVRTQEWFCIIRTCNASGLSKKQWCEENGVSVRKFFYWQKKIREDLYNGRTLQRNKEERSRDCPCFSQHRPAPVFAEIKATTVAETQDSQFQPVAVIKVGAISVQIANTATSELLERIGSTLLHHAI